MESSDVQFTNNKDDTLPPTSAQHISAKMVDSWLEYVATYTESKDKVIKDYTGNTKTSLLFNIEFYINPTTHINISVY